MAQSKDLFTMVFEAGKDKMFHIRQQDGKLIDSVEIANIPYISYSDKANQYQSATFNKGYPHIVELSDKEFPFDIFDKSGNKSTNEHLFRTSTHYKGIQMYNDYYNVLEKRILQCIKYLDAKFFLTDKDIAEFNQFTPVYISQFGAYFFVSKIRNYVAGQLTECELYRLSLEIVN